MSDEELTAKYPKWWARNREPRFGSWEEEIAVMRKLGYRLLEPHEMITPDCGYAGPAQDFLGASHSSCPAWNSSFPYYKPFAAVESWWDKKKYCRKSAWSVQLMRADKEGYELIPPEECKGHRDLFWFNEDLDRMAQLLDDTQLVGKAAKTFAYPVYVCKGKDAEMIGNETAAAGSLRLLLAARLLNPHLMLMNIEDKYKWNKSHLLRGDTWASQIEQAEKQGFRLLKPEESLNKRDGYWFNPNPKKVEHLFEPDSSIQDHKASTFTYPLFVRAEVPTTKEYQPSKGGLLTVAALLKLI